MAEIHAAVEKLLNDQDKLRQLLALEKQRRQVPADTLVFVGIHNAAQFWWSAEQAVLKSREMEAEFFAAYLIDRISYAKKLGQVVRLPKRHMAILHVGESISAADIEALLRARAEEQRVSRAAKSCHSMPLTIERPDDNGERVLFINPALPVEERRQLERDAATRGVRVLDDPKEYGNLIEQTLAEKYATIRWNFPWKHYVLVGVPDGIADEFVYEFKTTAIRFLPRVRPIALAQADLYGHFFNRSRKRVQIFTKEDGNTETLDLPVDQYNADLTLESFAAADAGEVPNQHLPRRNVVHTGPGSAIQVARRGAQQGGSVGGGMLASSFCHIPGVGMKLEQRLWDAGVTSWAALAACDSRHLRALGLRFESLVEHLQHSTRCIRDGDIEYFAAGFPTSEHWRLFGAFRESCLYLDIETTGLRPHDCRITTMATFDGREVRHFVQGQNLQEFPEYLSKYALLVTYYGKNFDVPFIEREFGIRVPHAHIDLCFVLRSLGIKGGLKGCERQLEIRRDGMEDLNGFDAVRLWHDHCLTRNRKMLETLLAYNVQDTVNLERLMVEAYNRKVARTPFEAIHCLPEPAEPRNPFVANRAVISRVLGK